jgi:energy-coupling factor transporter ATP-binding protein EcfA2
MAAKPLPEAPPELIILPWDRFGPMFAKEHKQGEHVAIVGPTGGGKSQVAFALAKILGARTDKDRRPSRVTVLGSKPARDDTLSKLHAEGWPYIKKWPPAYGEEHCIIWPRGGTLSQAATKQRAVFVPVLDAIHSEGSQTVVVDEEAHFEESRPEGLGMRGMMGPFWSGARSNKITMIGATQRPRNVTRLMWSESSWVIVLKPEDDDDFIRVAELTGHKRRDKREWFYSVVENLGPYEFVCIRRQRGGGRGMYISRVDK